ncbi:MAG: hypothetical protein ACPLQO_10590 [Desulfotomaculales bacterium]
MPTEKKRVYGVLARYRVPGADASGYRPVWDTGRAAAGKRKSRRSGLDRPAE